MNQKDRYSKQVILPEIGASGQERLSATRVLVVGAGGLGCPALQYLAGAGIGTIGIIDHDIVDVSNLHRQILYKTDDLGRLKATVARERLVQLNPDITVTAYTEKLDDQNVLGLFSAYDIIVDGTDNFSTKFLINDAAVKTGKTVVYGAIQGFEGQASVFDAVRGPCYRCLYPEPPPPGTVLSCAATGVVGALPGIIGAVQAMEVIKLAINDPALHPLIGRLWMLNAHSMETGMVSIPKRGNCSVCSHPPSEIILQNASPTCYAALAEEADYREIAGVHLIDVRELHEWEAGHINGAQHLPLSVLQKNVNTFMPATDGRRCVIYCQCGQRSRTAVEILLSAGYQNISSLKGGYEAWKNGKTL
ncbi:MAG: HesA/MoeB/ThiF family protein [Proteobacteria bacterium]|nr:HesA/MoeB/ThiF family protein [Pseudomonadota bacterium]